VAKPLVYQRLSRGGSIVSLQGKRVADVGLACNALAIVSAAFIPSATLEELNSANFADGCGSCQCSVRRQYSSPNVRNWDWPAT
jgi:hypothetical protein